MVEDSSERVLAYVPHGVRWFGAPAPAAGRTERVRATVRAETAVTGHLIPWRNHMLRVLLPGQPFSVWQFWSPEWEFKSYYVNLEAPFARSAVGFDSSDHVLDVCVRADRTWYFKDQDELDARVEVGLVDAEAASAGSGLAPAGAAAGVGCARFGDRALAAIPSASASRSAGLT